jgi:hypothetical protein
MYSKYHLNFECQWCFKVPWKWKNSFDGWNIYPLKVLFKILYVLKILFEFWMCMTYQNAITVKIRLVVKILHIVSNLSTLHINWCTQDFFWLLGNQLNIWQLKIRGKYIHKQLWTSIKENIYWNGHYIC